MARRVRDAVLDTRAARKRLKPRAEPHWRALALGLHLGYRRRARDGSWVARRRNDGGQYIESKLGLADDWLDANGATVLDYAQAQAAAKSWADEEARREHGLGPKNAGPYTVADAMKDYMADYKASGKKAADATQTAIDAHILPKLGATGLAKLDHVTVRGWFRGLAAAPPRVRGRRGQTRFRDMPAESDKEAAKEAARKRRATANRILSILKAALNHAMNEERKITSDAAWKSVKPFRGVDKSKVRYLSTAETVRLVNACCPHGSNMTAFRDLVRAALLTGCRYGELIALRVGDVNLDVGTAHVRDSKGGSGRHVTLTDEGQRFFAQMVAGKASGAILLKRDDGDEWGKSHQQRPLSEACKVAKISPPATFHHLRHTHAATLAMAGVPIGVIAKQLGHKDTRVTEKHYAHLAPSYVSDTIRAHFPTLGIVPASNVARLKPKAQTNARHRRG